MTNPAKVQVDYAGSSAARPRVALPEWTRRWLPWLCVGAAAIGLLATDAYLIRRSDDPSWHRWLAPACLAVAAGLCWAGLTRDRAGRRSALPVGGLAVALTVGLGAYLTFGDRLTVCSETPYRSICASRLRQVGYALEVYATANGGALPPELAYAAPVMLSPESLVCPLSRDKPARLSLPGAIGQWRTIADPAHGSCSFTYVAHAVPLAALPPTAVLAYETTTANHGGDGRNVLFADGHVEFVAGPLPSTRPIAAAPTATAPAAGPTSGVTR